MSQTVCVIIDRYEYQGYKATILPWTKLRTQSQHRRIKSLLLIQKVLCNNSSCSGEKCETRVGQRDPEQVCTGI